MAIRVLVVDDDPSFRVAVTTLLQDRGFVVAGYAADQHEALASLSRCGPDAILLDVFLDRDDGLETLRVLRQTGWTGPVLLTSSNAQAVSDSLAVELGAAGFIPKEDLVAAQLSEYLRRGAGGS